MEVIVVLPPQVAMSVIACLKDIKVEDALMAKDIEVAADKIEAALNEQ